MPGKRKGSAAHTEAGQAKELLSDLKSSKRHDYFGDEDQGETNGNQMEVSRPAALDTPATRGPQVEMTAEQPATEVSPPQAASPEAAQEEQVAEQKAKAQEQASLEPPTTSKSDVGQMSGKTF